MSLALQIMLGLGSSLAATTYVEDVFSAYTYTGTGATQSIVTGFQPDFIWGKSRANGIGHYLFDSQRGRASHLVTETTAAASTGSLAGNDLASFDATGFTLGPNQVTAMNSNTQTKVVWAWKKAAKFFDVVTYTGNGANRTISHSLGQAPGMILVKKYSAAGTSWFVYHRSLGATKYLVLETTAAEATASTVWNDTDPTASVFSIGGAGGTNNTGDSFVAYLFAHDTASTGMIQCGSYVADGANPTTVTLGFEPQMVLWKPSSITGQWFMADTARGMPDPASAELLFANLSDAASSGSGLMKPTATGFVAGATTAGTYIYMAIRRPMKTPTSGTQVYQAIARTGTGATANITGVGFAPDLLIGGERNALGGGLFAYATDRLRGAGQYLKTTATDAEASSLNVLSSWDMDGVTVGTGGAYNSASGYNYINWFFKRAPGFFDVVCYDETSNPQTVSHGLSVTPELMIHKIRGEVGDWRVYHKDVDLGAAFPYPRLNGSDAGWFSAAWIPSTPTATTFAVDYQRGVASRKHVAYLFATLAGISKVGSYTGTAATLQIDCGFSAGARFVMIKRTDSTGDWYVWDTVRGIVSGNDPYLLINSTAAETTGTDYLDPYASGFELSSTAPSALNASGGTYIYLAIA